MAFVLNSKKPDVPCNLSQVAVFDISDCYKRMSALSQVQSFDQEFENMNKALKLSCMRGLPVRVVRSFKVRTVLFLHSSKN
jgi:hypothetical protein